MKANVSFSVGLLGLKIMLASMPVLCQQQGTISMGAVNMFLHIPCEKSAYLLNRDPCCGANGETELRGEGT